MTSRLRASSSQAGLALAIGALLLGSLVWQLAEGRSSSASYQISRQTIDAGAGRATSASYMLNGSIGQPDAGPWMSSASFRLTGGFHRTTATGEQSDTIFADRFQGN